MNKEIDWLCNDGKVEELREDMLKAREEFRKRNPEATEDAEEKFLKKKFIARARQLMEEQLNLVGSSLL